MIFIKSKIDYPPYINKSIAPTINNRAINKPPMAESSKEPINKSRIAIKRFLEKLSSL